MKIQYYTDEDYVYHPLWTCTTRDFVDLRCKEAEEFNGLLEKHFPKQVKEWNCTEDGWSFDFEDLIVDVLHDGINPVKTRVTSWSLPRSYLDPLRHRLIHILGTRLETRHDMTGFAIIILRLLEEAVIFVDSWKRKTGQDLVAKGIRKGWDLKSINETTAFDDLQANAVGADIDTIDESGDDLLGTSIKDICKAFPQGYRILHVEPVFRSDLVSGFRHRQAEMFDDLMNQPHQKLRSCVGQKTIPGGFSKLDLARELCKPHVTYHGTQRRVVSSIIRHGFVIPGHKAGDELVGIRCGATFGIGVYSSPDPSYALSYTRSGQDTRTRPEDIPGLRLIVCATLMGLSLSVTREETLRTTGVAEDTAHSHVSPSKLEYIVFDKRQIIPCYVIHFDFGPEFAKEQLNNLPIDSIRWKPKKEHPKLVKQEVFPADVVAAKEARKAAAAKWFPYGFGPASGTSFVIEEIGEVSDDEENYGDYQGERVEVDDEVSKWNDGIKKGGSWFDEYQKSR